MKKIGVFFIVILVVALLGTSGYIVYDKFFATDSNTIVEKKDSDKESTVFNMEVLEVTDSEVLNLYQRINKGVSIYCGVSDYYKDVKVKSTDLSNDLVYKIALQSLADKGLNINLVYTAGGGDNFEASKLDLEIASIFGENYKFEHKDYLTCPSYKFNPNTNTYEFEHAECGGTCGPGNMEKIVKAIKYEDKIEVYLRVIFSGTDENNQLSYYKDYNRTQKLTDLEKNSSGFIDDSDLNMQKGSLYKLVFEKENDNYVFGFSEPVE